MNTLNTHLDKYLKLRRQLGYKLRVAGILLRDFVRFAEEEGASFITTKMALRWATQPNIKPVQRGNRLGMVRRFAEYVSALDARTERTAPYRNCDSNLSRPPHYGRHTSSRTPFEHCTTELSAHDQTEL